MYNRCYFSKGNFETMREKLEEYVAQHKVVSREDVTVSYTHLTLPTKA